MAKSYKLNFKELAIHYPKSDLEILKKYQPFDWIKDEYFNYGYGDSGYYVYLKYKPEMANEKWRKNFIEEHSIGFEGKGLIKLYSGDLIGWKEAKIKIPKPSRRGLNFLLLDLKAHFEEKVHELERAGADEQNTDDPNRQEYDQATNYIEKITEELHGF